MREPRHASTMGMDEAPASSKVWGPVRMIWGALRGIVEGALPAIILVCIVALFWETLTIVRYVTIPNGFAVTQEVEMAIALGGAAISLIVFLVAGVRTLRGVRDRQLEGDYIESTATMVSLGVTLLILLIVIWTTAGTPQTPAP